jgi:iron complex outermembrane receptor protein
VALACALVCAQAALAQTAQGTAAETQTITITGRASAAQPASVAGFGDVPLSRSPFSATVLSLGQLQDAGIASLGDITRLDAGLTDAYNAPGYWGQLAARGFTLDNRSNFRRDGLPINAETALPTANKAALELLKGTSGVQAGTSSPGGLLNLVVKRPLAQPRRAGSIEWSQPGTLALAADLSDRAGADGAFGWRLNAESTRLDPPTRDSRGRSHLLAGAAEWRLGAGTLLEVEAEHNRQRQPSTPGFSLLGNRLPDAKSIDPRLNLNNQAWTLPVVFEGATGSVRLTHDLAREWRLSAHAMQQRLDSEDRIAFPYGCDAEGNFDRYCSDGSFDLYDFRSERERRTTRAFDLALQGRAALGGTTHHLTLGVLRTGHEARFQRQAYNYAGVGLIDGSARVPPDAALTDENTNRREHSTELRLLDRVELSSAWSVWLGTRHSRIERRSVRTDGSRATAYTQSFTTPWAALAWSPNPGLTAYVSAGQGIESEVAPNRPRYTNAGQGLPALKSRQVELGIKGRGDALQWQVAAFDIERPVWSDIRVASGRDEGSCSDARPCTRQADGVARHRGLEADAEWQLGDFSLRGSVLALQARRQGAANAERNGLRPTNVPERSAKLQAAWNVPALPGLALLGFVSHEGDRMVLADNSVVTDGWTRVDLGLRYQHRVGGARWVWRAGVDNVADTRAWKETPFQFGHAYLYPLAPRTWRAALNVTL